MKIQLESKLKNFTNLNILKLNLDFFIFIRSLFNGLKKVSRKESSNHLHKAIKKEIKKKMEE